MRTARRWTGMLGLMLALSACGGGGGGGGGYGAGAVSLGTDVLVTDIDGDGRADVLALSHLFGDQQPEGRLLVYRQTSTGRFAPPESYAVGCYPWSMTLADVDGDGRPDLVVADVGAWNCTDPQPGKVIYLLQQDGAHPGHFLSPRLLAGDVYTYQTAVADLNGDGAPDIAFGVSLVGSRSLTVLYQDASRRGTFLPPTEVAMPGSVSEIVAGDIDGDGRADLFFHMYFERTGYTPNSALAIAVQRRDGTLGAAISLAAQTGLNVQRLTITDVNGDGRVDLLARFTPSSTDYQPKLTVLLQGDSPLTWSAPMDTSLQGIHGTSGTAFGDLNADGRPDVALAGTFPTGSEPLSPPNFKSQVNLIFRSGAANYTLGQSISLPIDADAVGIGDVDGDGRNDLVLLEGSDILRLMLQSRSVAGTFGDSQPLP